MAQDEENLDVVNDNSSSGNRSGGNATEQAVSQMARKKLKDKIATSKLGVAVKKVFAKLTAFIKTYIVPIIIALVILVCVIGLIAFIINMPGLIRGNLSANFVGKITEFFKGSNYQLTGKEITKEDRIELLQYITDMGIDVEGFGFAPSVEYEKDENGNETDQIKNYTTNLMDGGKDDEGTTKYPKGDLVYYYLMANERAFIRNDDGILGTIFGTEAKWTGMIDIYGDEGLDGIETNIDRENLLLKISVNNARDGQLLSEDQYSFSLEEWTGRYGIPVEFSLALHLATMSSGMVEELLTHEDLQTAVTVGLQKAECTINFKFRINQDGTIKEIDIPFNAPDGDVTSLTTKLQNGDEITKDDVSIEGLVHALNHVALYDYEVVTVDYTDDVTIYNYGHDENDALLNASRHIETIDAILSDSDLAVYVADKCTEKSTIEFDDLGFPVIYSKPVVSSRLYDINAGAFICKYNENGEPDENTGKLKIWKLESTGITLGYFSKTEENKDTDEFYWYTYQEENIEINGGSSTNTTSSNSWELVPKQEEAYYKNGEEIVAYSQRIKGLKYYKDNGITAADTVQLANDYEAYEAMFKEIDWFISYVLWYNNWDKAQFNYNRDNGFNELIETGDINTISYYTSLFQQLSEDGITPNEYDILFGENGIYEQLQEDLEKIKELSPKTEKAQEHIETILENLGFPGLTKELIQEMYEKFKQTDDVNNETVKYVQPYIVSVIKHWYKDIDFTKAYSNTSGTIELAYTDSTNLPEGVEVVTILTPTDDSQTLLNQSEQPYVIKGDLVLCDGEVQEDAQLSNIYEVSENSNGYNWGDGYRATKKILTQGYYYTFDGTHETAKSIYFQEEIEKGKDKLFYFKVANGRISETSIISGDNKVPVSKASSLTKNEIVDEKGVFTLSFIMTPGVEQIYNENGITVYNIKEIEEETDSNETEEKNYIIYIKGNNMKYLSPADDNTQETVEKRVQIINSVWDSIGVVCKRVPLSFDNVVENSNDTEDTTGSADGQIMSITGLSILKNTQSKDAEFIYRDLKEMLIELGYYTQAEFDYLDSDVLTWFIPEYNPTTWPQNNGEGDFYAALYPKEEVEEAEDTEQTDETSEEQDEEQTLEDILSFDKAQGFEPDLDVIAPGDCIIINQTDEGIEIEFDGISQPEIGILDGYTMIIKGINTESGVITTTDENGEEIQISYEDAVKNGTVIKVGSVLGKTGTDVIEVHLLNDKGGVLSNVEDYMAPDIATKYSGDGSLLSQIAALRAEGIQVGQYANEDNDAYRNAMKYYNLVLQYSNQYGLDPYFVIAVICDESGGNPTAEFINNGVSYSGGLMQYEYSNGTTYTVHFQDGTSKTFTNLTRENILSDVNLQIELGCAMLKAKMEAYYNNIPVVLQAYNFGDAGIRSIIKAYLAGYTGQSASTDALRTAISKVSDDEYIEYVKSGDLSWLNSRVYYKQLWGGGTANYVEKVLQWYNLVQD